MKSRTKTQKKNIEWEVKKLGEVCDTGAGGTPLKSHKEYYENGDIPWLRSGEVCKKYISESELYISKEGLENSSAKLFPPNTVLVAMYGATAGQVGILKFESTTNQAVCGILPNEKMVPEFLYYFFTYGKEGLVKQAVGGAQPNISQQKIKNTTIPFLSMFEQKRIVGILDEVFADIEKAKENAEKNLENAKELFESYLQGVFENKGDNWEEKKLGEVCEKTSNIKWQDFKKQEFKYVDLSAVSRDSLNIKSSVFVNFKNAPSRAKKIIKTGDIIFATTRPTLKRIAKVYGEFNNQICSTGFTVLRNLKDKILSEIIYYFLQTNIFMDSMEKLQRGASYPAVSDTDVKNQILSFPKSLEKQKQIVKKLDELSGRVEEYEAILRSKIADLEELKKSVLEKAFEGEL